MTNSKIKKTEELQLDDSIKVNRKGEAILGRLTGPCADIVNPTRNERFYSEQLWEKVFKNPIVAEYFESGGILGELNHPADRTETDLEKVAICMPEPPVKDNQGHLVGSWDILDTPNGRIAYTLAKYGYKLGISSRGSGDVVENLDGTENVNEDTYDFQGFDLVLLPAVKAARLQLAESLQQNGKTFKQAICEALDTASADDKKIMTETLDRLDIDYKSETIDNKVESVDTSGIMTESIDQNTAENIGVNDLSDLTEALRENRLLDKQIKELQEKLSVCYAKETAQEDEISKLKSVIISLTENVKSGKAAKAQVSTLTEQLNKANEKIDNQRLRLEKLMTLQNNALTERNELTESLNTSNKSINSLNSKVKSLSEQLNTERKEAEKSKQQLTESIENLKKDAAIKKAEFDSKIRKANSLIESYKRTARLALDKLIESKAVMLGTTVADIKSKLPENYSFSDIDALFESMQQYQVSMSKLPLNISSGSPKAKVKITESVDPILNNLPQVDDVVDDALLTLANLK